MSLVEDFNHYYRNTYIGFRSADGRVRPFFVTEVQARRGLSSENQYTEEGLTYLKFVGRVLDMTHDGERDTVASFENVVLTLPELGYVVVNGTPRWVRYRPVQQRLKGLHQSRLSGISRLNDNIAISIYRAAHEQPNGSARQFAFHEGHVLYKGRIVGRFEGNRVTLQGVASYLAGILNKCFPDKIVEV